MAAENRTNSALPVTASDWAWSDLPDVDFAESLGWANAKNMPLDHSAKAKRILVLEKADWDWNLFFTVNQGWNGGGQAQSELGAQM